VVRSTERRKNVNVSATGPSRIFAWIQRSRPTAWAQLSSHASSAPTCQIGALVKDHRVVPGAELLYQVAHVTDTGLLGEELVGVHDSPPTLASTGLHCSRAARAASARSSSPAVSCPARSITLSTAALTSSS